MEIASKYNPAEVEGKWYQYWLDNGFFKSKPDGREPYTIVIPPPNVTGVLHMGHMLNNTIQDILVRRARMMGKNACWVPGTDHASIATEAKVVNRLAGQGKKKTVNWGLPAIGIVRRSRWTRNVRRALLRFLSIYIRRA